MEKIFEGDVKPDFDELCEYERISNKQSYGGSYFSFYALGCVVLAGAIIDILLPSTTNWFFVAAAVLAGLFFLFQPGVFIPEVLKNSVRKHMAASHVKKNRILLTDCAVIQTPLPGSPPSYSEINIPYSRLSAVLETEKLFLFCIDNSRAVILPKRYVNAGEADRIRTVSGARMF